MSSSPHPHTFRLSPVAYKALTDRAAAEPELYWEGESRRLNWSAEPSQAYCEEQGWFVDGALNASVNCLDRHLATRADQAALIWQAEDADRVVTFTYRTLHEQVCRLANVLRSQGVRAGDRVAIHLPSVPEGLIAMLACARLGAIHVVLFGGFSPEAIADRLADSGAVLVITANVGRRGAKRIPFKTTLDAALDLRPEAHAINHVLVVSVTDDVVSMKADRDMWLSPLLEEAAAECAPQDMPASAPLFLLYTSGSTGKPKGIVHGTGGYLVWASYTHELVFDHQEGDVFWCTADIGWITGHTYGVYGPLLNGGTILLFEGMPSHPGPGRWWNVIQDHKVTTFYTSPTAIRALMREGNDVVQRYDLSSLRVLGTVGEPISQEAWSWFNDHVGGGRCAFVDTWWQTESGGIMISPVPGAVREKPASATLPLPGVHPVLLDERGAPKEGATEGVLCLRGSWPGRALTIWNDAALFERTYLQPYSGYYFTGDGARRDEDGYYWITGRVDDVINVSGHRIGSAEIEDALATELLIAESAAIGIPHDLKGQGIVVYVVPRDGAPDDLHLRAAKAITSKVGRYAAPERIHVVPDLPKTRSGKSVRRLLRKIACGETEGFGDLSTLADPEIVATLISIIQAPKS
ncbi:acetate--CoA ligase [Gluconobacter roseus]|uniref:Acetate--CoA ligase n=1 Tax=Gluconobacter roseus NBRC 3990 TaxID=1307950 RepID=A0A4Y3MBL2_9PROT|nr:acetate--CoA ligase [Gluconobacter roseus]KXV43608.1 acetyl-CoA synthetase [Gluconobacter roseus]GBR47170.1 acetyl-CoA synthetase [Gluconobacter roseus NBRC 3990]GEB04651.1 acetyl-coenzyme A synthetase [Gluconobacter roseus NBRC 3990]GLP92214.1 acetyl-coenzyme A synthetase [Gluconobacter roseus NBRC 3990]